MPYSTNATDAGVFEIEFNDEPKWVHALEMAVAAPEREIAGGRWLILVYAVWSMQDHHAIDTALEYARVSGGELQLGVRPFDEFSEIARWCPDVSLPSESPVLFEAYIPAGETGSHLRIYGDPRATPIWLALEDGRLKYQTNGPLTAEQIAEMVRDVF